MFTLGHISDLHLGPLPDIRYRELANKRITGYVNWHRTRSSALGEEVLNRVAEHILESSPDHVAITGDMTNLALETEIESARQWLEGFGNGQFVSLVPGNHDAYVPGALDKACRAWSEWMGSDGATTPINSRSFPYMRVRGPLALIGISTARASAPFMATGYFRRRQATGLAQMLDKARQQGLCRVVMIHHPPVRRAAQQHKRLSGINLFQRVVSQHGAELILHGHTHLPTLHCVEGTDGPVPVVGVSATGQHPGGNKPAGGWNRFDIAPNNHDGWAINLRRYAVTGETTPLECVAEIQLDQLDMPIENPDWSNMRNPVATVS
ncbi:metallophosphoesterase [Notoacmeibacter sp. MSK16QG-6]|uniref:metallophosphoesterase family protein n=1 Tax=Notoacmeibacter sp. MSK16QG-6 TaxID=2957982 RepID=UPI00209DC160|nr:metallophosphoesterase [Notoacmeibacter sp. MSK16QG-6]MCP1199906.1 metallophosphoesterase [Notoacmeibacter sp. MSK16QG-6]